MMKFWARTIKGEKILVNKIVEVDMKMTSANFPAIIREICLAIDEPTPLVLDSQYLHFQEFNVVRFKESDFVESVNFDKFTVEAVIEK